MFATCVFTNNNFTTNFMPHDSDLCETFCLFQIQTKKNQAGDLIYLIDEGLVFSLAIFTT